MTPLATRRRYAGVLGALTALFALRVAGQALQRWAPIDGLPHFGDFQGSGLPYGLLLGVQLVILGVMLWLVRGVAAGTPRPHPHSARVLGWIGGLYMAGSLARIGAGLALRDPPPWFTAWIPAFFHVVLAAFVLTLAAYHSTARRGASI